MTKTFKRRSSGAGKVIAAVVTAAVMLAGGIVVGYGWGTKWTFKQPVEQSATPDKPSTLSVDGGGILRNGTSNGMTIAATAVALSDLANSESNPKSAENVWNLSVTYTPENTTFQETTYSIAFKDPNSKWATGKFLNEYATLTQSAEGSKDATLTVLQPFCEQIIVTAQSVRNPQLKATTTVDYLGYYNFCMYNILQNIDDQVAVSNFGLTQGSIAPNNNNALTIKVDLGEAYIARLQNCGYTVEQYVTYTFDNTTSEEDTHAPVDLTVRNIILDAGGYGKNTTHSQEETNAYWQAACKEFLNGKTPEYYNGNVIFTTEFICNRVYNGTTYNSMHCDYQDMELNDYSGFETSATGITTNNSSVVAG